MAARRSHTTCSLLQPPLASYVVAHAMFLASAQFRAEPRGLFSLPSCLHEFFLCCWRNGTHFARCITTASSAMTALFSFFYGPPAHVTRIAMCRACAAISQSTWVQPWDWIPPVASRTTAVHGDRTSLPTIMAAQGFVRPCTISSCHCNYPFTRMRRRPESNMPVAILRPRFTAHHGLRERRSLHPNDPVVPSLDHLTSSPYSP